MKVFPLKLKDLTTDSFAAFGRVLMPHTDIPTKSGEGWICFSDIDRINPDVPLMVGKVFCSKAPDIIDSLEGHTSREELLWATEKDIVMVVAEPEDINDVNRKPDVSKTSVFHIRKGQAVIIGKGTWHSPAFSLDGSQAEYFFLVEAKKDSIDQDDNPWIQFRDDSAIAILK